MDGALAESKVSKHNDEALSLTQLAGIGPKIAEKLQKIGIFTVQDVLFHLPYRYEDRTRVVSIGSLRSSIGQVIEGVIEHAEIAFSRRGRSRRMLLCYLADGTGGILLRFFNFNKQQQARLVAGTRLRCFGDVRPGNAKLEMIHPEYTVLAEGQHSKVEECLTPIYATTEGVHQTLLRKISQQALQLLEQGQILEDYLPASLLEEFKLPTLAQAITYVHRPPPNASLDKLAAGQHPSQKRLALEELLAHHLSLQALRDQHRQHDAIALDSQNHLLHRFIRSLPFELTSAQLKVNQEVLKDLEHSVPMMRLVQGDVGSGKTVVAAMACLKAIEAGYQAALMAPTEILSEQHYQNFRAWFEPLGITVAWLSGKLKGKKRQQMLDMIIGADAMMVVGTHALFQEEVQFNRLALAVIDEQHRFGVHQRLALRDKGVAEGQVPHQLIMTATPIPRSLAMTAYADLDYSVIDELPPGRTPVTTVAIGEERREEVIQRVEQSCTEGRQAYWVCTLIEESDVLQCQAAENTSAMLVGQLPGLRIGLVHGRLKASEKEQVMGQFKQGHIDLLVATTVIEVGVDVPNASLMIIENAERLGLSQLHQLRGRVGRGSNVSHCVLMYRNPLSELAKARLSIMRKSNSGFDIAQKDLEIRGPGEVLGTKQTGNIQMRIADVVRDEYMLVDVKKIAHKLGMQQPASIQPIIRRWLGQQQAYGSVG